jgi:energy-coupling factor transport system substrate-specific component
MKMKSNKLSVKDLVTIGIFAVVYFVVMFGVGMMGMVPILFLIYPTVLGVVTGTIIMLFMAKVQKPWAIFILGMLSPLLMFSMGHMYILLVHSIIIMGIAEFIRKAGDYNSFKHNMFSFAVFNTWVCGSIMQVLLAKDRYLGMSASMMGEEFAGGMEKLVTYPNMALVYLGAILGGVIGAYIGKALLKKHFEKAGIV